MSEKTVSQKIARVFEIVDYFLLLPALLGLYFGLIMLGEKDSFFMGAGICTIFVIGTVLLVGYFKHSRGTLSAEKSRLLWIGTIVYNGLFLLPTLFFIFSGSLSGTSSGKLLTEILFSPYGWIIVWWTIAVGGSIIALGDCKGGQKYR